MGMRLVRASVFTISGLRAVLRVAVVVVVSFLVAAAFVSMLVSIAGAAAAAALPLLGIGVGLLVVETVGFSSVFFFAFGDFGFAMMGYSLHAPKCRNDW